MIDGLLGWEYHKHDVAHRDTIYERDVRSWDGIVEQRVYNQIKALSDSVQLQNNGGVIGC